MRRIWTHQEVERLKELFPHHPTPHVCRVLGRTASSVNGKAESLGLRKSPERMAQFYAESAAHATKVGMATRLKKGNVPANKGKKMPDHVRAKTAATQFKKGVRQGKAEKLYKPIGAERITKDGYLERKIHDGMPLQSRWRAVHVLNWEAANGPVPKGMAVVFRDRNPLNTSLENLELVTRAELMRRNTIQNYPPDLKRTIRTLSKLKRQINEKQDQ